MKQQGFLLAGNKTSAALTRLQLRMVCPCCGACACSTTRNIPEFKVAPELALELLMAANFLDT